MRKNLIREMAFFAILLIFLAFVMHPDLLSDPNERFSLMQERHNFIHPFIYAFIVYIFFGIVRIIVKKVIKIFAKKKNT